MVYNGEALDISYAGSQPLSLTYDGATYYYVLNGQGDVIGLTNSSGKMVIGYTYGAYGGATGLVADPELSYVLVQMNPLIYRGYVNDRETTLYYLQSRYYDPELGRFINADAYASTGQGILGNNMFAYCLNNPVNMSDRTGNIPWALIVPGLIGGGVAALSSFLDGNSGGQVIKDGISGALMATILVFYPELAIVLTGMSMADAILECYYQGLSLEESLLYLGIAGISEISFPQTGNDMIDLTIDAVYGTSKNILCQLGENAILDNNSQIANQEATVCRMYSMFAAASYGGCGIGISAICLDVKGGHSLCFRQ